MKFDNGCVNVVVLDCRHRCTVQRHPHRHTHRYTHMTTISKILNKASKLEYTPSQAHKALTTAGVSVPEMPLFLQLWDLSKNLKGIVNFGTVGHLLTGYALGVASANVKARKTA